MSDTYQAIYDAVRSRISGGDISQAVEEAIREANLSYYASMLVNNAQSVLSEYERPCALFKPSVSIDGGKWCALYGENLQGGVVGFGDSPSEAMSDFDKAWYSKLNQQPPEQKK